jgi:hypothetical protein
MKADELTWSDVDLRDAFDRYKIELAAAGLAGPTLNAYEYRAGRFLRWRERDGISTLANADRLASDLVTLREELQAAGKAPRTVRTYVDGATRFLRWLVGDYVPQATKGHAAPVWTPVHEPQPNPMDEWSWEGNVVSAVVTFLSNDGWQIRSVADTERRERGVDISAQRNGLRLALEVKGYPSAAYVRGSNAGHAKRANPSALATQFLAAAVFTALGLTSATWDLVAIALPNTPRYRDLLQGVRGSLSRSGIGIMIVNADGTGRWDLDPVAKAELATDDTARL